MAMSENTDSDRQGAVSMQRGISEALLRTEIGFWRDMIVSCRDTESPDSLERMQHALKLAETRLAQMSGKMKSNVLCIDAARGGVK
jgi:hypothetical protein